MSSQISVCNQALLMIGDKIIQNLLEDTTEAEIANVMYPDARNHVLRDIKPTFAIVRAIPPAQGAVIDANLPVTYALPTDYNVMLSVLNGSDPSVPWIIEGLNILSQTGLTQFVYISNNSSLEALFDASFVKALAAYLSSEFCYALTGSATKSIEQMQLYNVRKMACLEVYGMESATRSTYSTQLLEDR